MEEEEEPKNEIGEWDTRKYSWRGEFFLNVKKKKKEKRIEKSVDPRRKKVDSGDADRRMGLALGMRTGNPCRRDVRRFAKPY